MRCLTTCEPPMLVKQKDADLTQLNSLGLTSHARFLLKASCLDEYLAARDFAQHHRLPLFPLGGGSNVILPSRLNAMVLQCLPTPVQWLPQEGQTQRLIVPAGYSWHQLVLETCARGLFGLENLALIPGHCGAAPVQNIGAYGAELAQTLEAVQVVWLQTGQQDWIDAKDCQLSYRDSRFKRDWKGHVLITALQLRLKTQAEVNLDYADLAQRLARSQADLGTAFTQRPLPEQVAQVVMQIRREKLPDPALLGNVGSYFKNPRVSQAQAQQLKQDWPDLPVYPDGDQVKLAAGWLIDQCGFKGQRLGAFAVHDQQALVLTHLGGGQREGLLDLEQQIQAEVWRRFAVQLAREPEWVEAG